MRKSVLFLSFPPLTQALGRLEQTSNVVFIQVSLDAILKFASKCLTSTMAK